MTNNALATRKKTDALVNQLRHNPIATITSQYDQLAQVANVTFPPTALDNLPPMHKPSPSVIRVDKGRQSNDTYNISRDQLGLSKHTILKMLASAGCSWKTEKLTPNSDLSNIRYTAWVWRKLPDGSFQTGQGSKSWSWDKCLDDFVRKATSKGKTEEDGRRNALQYREFADEQTETKALLRAARAILSIKTSYHPDELDQPFLFLKVVPDLDMNDPEIKRMMAQRIIDSTVALYGQPQSAPELPPTLPPAAPEPAAEEFDDDDEIPEMDIDSEDAAFSSPEPSLESDPFAPVPTVEAGPPCCTDCGNQIASSQVAGRGYSASQIVDMSTDKYGVPLCIYCVARRKQVA